MIFWEERRRQSRMKIISPHTTGTIDPTRLIAIDYFRGIAILFVVVGHCYGPWGINRFGEKVFANIITGGTSLFVFISGYLFHHIYYENFNFARFLEKKTKYVFFPYVILTLMGIVYYISAGHPLPQSSILGIGNLLSWTDYVKMTGVYLWTGGIAYPYWYIPFILIIFLLSPFFVQYIRLSRTSRIVFFFIFLISAMIIQRPYPNISPLHSVLYFIPVYLLGILCSIHRKSVNNFIKDRSIILGCIAVALSALRALAYNGYGNFNKTDIFSYNGIDIMILQKIAMCFFFLSFFQKYEITDIPALKLLASSSFALYFIHTWIVIVFEPTITKTFIGFLPGMAVFIITVPIVLSGSLLIAYTVKMVLKKNSRYVTGW